MTLSHRIKPVFTLILLTQITACSDSPSTATESSANQVMSQAIEKPNQPALNNTSETSNTTQEADNSAGADTLLPTISSASQEENSPYQKIDWDSLMPEDYRPEAVVGKYMEQLAELDDSDPKAMQLYGRIQAELDNAPINKKLNHQKVQLAGFITPLENTDGLVTEFLLVPYYGACIHVPPPPINQTVLIQMEEGSGIKTDKIYDPIWASGEILIEGANTDLAQAGYRIINANVKPYDEE